MSTNSSTHSARSTSRKSADKSDLSFEDASGFPSTIADAPDRSKRAKDYEKRVEGLLNLAMRTCAQTPATVPDAAAIITHGPAFASKLGDLADADQRVRRALDLVTSGTDNPYLALTLATLPLVAQILRNHETADVSGSRRVQVRIPFTKGKRSIGLNLKFKLRNPFLRSITHDPAQMTHEIFNNPDISAALAAQGVQVAWNGKA